MTSAVPIRTPDYRLRVFVSSTLGELADERRAVRDAVRQLRLAPVMFEAGARPHPARDLYRSYLAQSHIFLGIYWQRYGWIAPEEDISGLEDEYRLAAGMPKLIYVKTPAPDREPGLTALLERVKTDDEVSYRPFSSTEELTELVENDLAVLLTERFEDSTAKRGPSLEASANAGDRVAPVSRRSHSTLSRPITPLVGRERDIVEVLELTKRPDVRLLTLTGSGGIGKSRLALAVAERLSAADPGQLCWVSLAGVRNAQLVPSAIASALGLSETPRQSVLDGVCTYLGDEPHVIVLDNFEHVLPAAPLVVELLQRCPATTVLVASRSVLNVRGEHDVAVPPLPVTGESAGGAGPAVELFVDRAAAVSPGFRLTPDNQATVAEICRRLDGLPLAIELAAARTRLLTPEALLRRLDRRLTMLTSGARDLPERQQTLRATLDWDYDLLGDDERALFRRLSAFVDGCTLEAADAVIAADVPLRTELFEGISSLINKSLLRLDIGSSGEPRFVMLETIREYAQELLVENGEAREVHAAHRTYFIDLLHATFLRGADQVDQLSLLEDEHANFRVTIDRAVADGDVDSELRLVSELTPFWEIHGHLREGAARVNAALQRSLGRHDAARVRTLLAGVMFARIRLDHAYALTLIEEALSTARELSDDLLTAWVLKDFGIVCQELERSDESARHSREALVLFERTGEQAGAMRALNNLAITHLELGDYEQAATYLQQTYRRGYALGDVVAATRSFQNIGLAKIVAGEPAQAERLLIRALARFLALGSSWDVADCLDYLASAAALGGHFESAAVLVGVCDMLRTSIGAPRPPAIRKGTPYATEVLSDAMPAAEFAAALAKGRAITVRELPAYLASLGDAGLVDLADDTVEESLLAEVTAAPSRS